MKRLLLVLFMFLFFFKIGYTQNRSLWITYGQSTFMYSPGLEFNYFFSKRFGVDVGVNAYIQDYDNDKVVNVKDNSKFNFYNANIGVSAYVLKREEHKIGVIIGGKIYYGPEYVALHYYKEGGYNIYYDSSQLNPEFGVDFGVFYFFKRISSIIKYDHVRNNFRIGIGYLF